jgi:hydroxymethylpyrimidine/phosphomethylpyrimidine kinase
MRTALTIAGSDSGGGAGIQADLKSFAAVGVHGTSVLTCVTAQNTRAVASIFPLPTKEVRAQLQAVLDDFEVRGAKTGMLYSAEIVKTVADGLRDTDFPLVVDPVMVATVGARLEQDDFKDALVAWLLPRAELLTPNRREAERLAGFPILGLVDMERAARTLRDLGPQAVLVKGGHVAGELVDVLFDGKTTRRLRAFRYPKELHGAGCTLAASVAAYLAQGKPLLQAVESARQRVASGFLASYRAGRGVGIINSHVRSDRYEVWLAVTRGAEALSRVVPPSELPRGGLELTFAIPGAMSAEDLCAWRGPDRLAGFGAARDAASSLLAVLHVNPTLRAAATFKYSRKNAHRLAASRFAVITLRRPRGPAASRAEGWMERAIVEAGTAPDVLVDARNGGSETKMRVLGEDPERVVRKVRRIMQGGSA